MAENPEDLAAAASGAGEATDAAAEAAAAPDAAAESSSDATGGIAAKVKTVLFETEPDGDPYEVGNDDPVRGHFVIAFRKMLNGVVDAGITEGTPAVENLLRGTGGLVFRTIGSSSDDASDTDEDSVVATAEEP